MNIKNIIITVLMSAAVARADYNPVPANSLLGNNTGSTIAPPIAISSTAGILTFLHTPSSANLLSALSTSTGTGLAVFNNTPTFITPILGTPTSGNLANCTFPTLNQNTTGTAANLSGTPALPNGTTATTQGTNDSSTKLTTTAFINAAPVSLTGTGSVNIDCSASRNFYTTVTGNVTYAFTNAYDGMTIVVDVLGDSSHTVTFTGPHWPNGGTAPTQTLSQHDVWTFKQINSRITGSSLQNVQ